MSERSDIFFRHNTLVIDTNLLIDLFSTSNQRILLELSRLYEKVFIPDIVRQELLRKHGAESTALFRQRRERTERFLNDQNKAEIIYPVSSDDVFQRALTLSEENHLIHLADACVFFLCSDNCFICVTNDRNLKDYCDERSIENRWGLEIIYELFHAEILTAKDSVRIINELALNNALYNDEIVQEYIGYIEHTLI